MGKKKKPAGQTGVSMQPAGKQQVRQNLRYLQGNSTGRRTSVSSEGS